jgi:hypothetical protein
MLLLLLLRLLLLLLAGDAAAIVAVGMRLAGVFPCAGHHNDKSSHSRQFSFEVRKTQAPRPESPISLCWTLGATQQSSARRRDRPPRPAAVLSE